MDKHRASHNVLNLLERLRIMHDLLLRGTDGEISREEIRRDLEATLAELEQAFRPLL